MGIITGLYRKNFLKRYDKDEVIPYYSSDDFAGLECERGSFRNSSGVLIRYFTYNYAGYNKDKLILFCAGMGPGHTAYLAEIETLCRAGYRVLTLDYTGCGASEGEKLPSVNTPAHDALELLALLRPQEEVIPIGHSLGGYTALNVARLTPKITRAVIISGFVGISDEMIGFVKFRLLANIIERYEKKLDTRYDPTANRKYLSTTSDKLLWIHSTDDPMVNYKHNAERVLKMHNPAVRVITVENKKHDPQYSADALKTMNAWMGGYYRLIREKKLVTLEERRSYFADKPVGRMTEQDPAVFDEIFRFIGE